MIAVPEAALDHEPVRRRPVAFVARRAPGLEPVEGRARLVAGVEAHLHLGAARQAAEDRGLGAGEAPDPPPAGPHLARVLPPLALPAG